MGLLELGSATLRAIKAKQLLPPTAFPSTSFVLESLGFRTPQGQTFE